MDIVFTVLKAIVFGFFGLIIVLFVLAVLFGKRVVKQWEFEAEFRDSSGREFGEFDIELSHIDKKETEDTFKAEFKMRHASLAAGQIVQVFLDDTLVLQGHIESAGRIYLHGEHIQNQLTHAEAGQVCRVVFGGAERFSCAIVPD